jgi:hypothetical protein
MPKHDHHKAAEHHEEAAKSHRKPRTPMKRVNMQTLPSIRR